MTVDFDRDLPDPADDRVKVECSACGGSGWLRVLDMGRIFEVDCGACGGDGWVWAREDDDDAG